MRTLKQLRAEIRVRVPDIDDTLFRNDELDRELNRAYRKLVKAGELLKESAVTSAVDDQERYNLTSALIWLSDDNLTDSTATVSTTAPTATDTSIKVSDSTVFSNGQYVKINSEIILVGTASGNILSGCTRGVAGTTAAAHSIGDTIYKAAAISPLKIKRVDYAGYKIDPAQIDEIHDLDVT